MDFIEVKEEARDLNVHISVETDISGRFLGIQMNKLETSPILTNSNSVENCPACQCLLNIVVVVHCEQSSKEIKFKEEPELHLANSPDKYFSDGEDADMHEISDDAQTTDGETGNNTTLDALTPKIELAEKEQMKSKKGKHKEMKICLKCGKKCTAENFQRHLERCLRSDEPKCSTCLKSFTTWDAVKRHENKVHKKLYSQPCYICGQQFSSSFYLSEHIKGHLLNDMRPYKCDICQSDFKFKKSIKEHMRRIHMNADVPINLECDQCNRKFKNESTLQKHKKRHLPKPHFCRFCGKGWVYKSELEQHERTHMENRQHICEICGRRYKEKTDLSKHIKRTHTLQAKTPSERPNTVKEEFQCEICSKIILGENSYLTHKILHNIPAGSLECSECGMKLKNEKSVKTHVFRQHLPKKFVCRFCGHPWRYKSELVQHEMIHTDTRPFACTQCDFKFKLKGDLNRHLQLHIKREAKTAPTSSSIEGKA